MLSWSSNDAGQEVDLSAIAGSGDVVGVANGTIITLFATACAEQDDQTLNLARTELVRATDIAFMVDAAAVAANFEMMTRLADSTGARMPTSRLDNSADAIEAMGVAELSSRR